MSPALSNDCEIDCEVKKPLLHDLFDLLGLPVRNTGLSFFTIWSSENIDEDVVSNKFYSTGSKKTPKIFCPETQSTVKIEINKANLKIKVLGKNKKREIHWFSTAQTIDTRCLRRFLVTLYSSFSGKIRSSKSHHGTYDHEICMGQWQRLESSLREGRRMDPHLSIYEDKK